jgi:hypothetical protein
MEEAVDDAMRTAMQKMLGGFRVSQMIAVAARLGVADHLKDGPKTVRDLAEATGTHEGALYRVLRTLACIGIFTEEDGRSFRLTPMAELLLSDVPGSLRVAAEVVGEEWNWRPWGALLHSVKTGETAFDHLYGESTWDWFAEHPAAARLFDQYMDANTSADAEAVVAAFDFSGVRTIVDVAGGRGALLTAILRRHTSARGILFNLPAVIESARGLVDGAVSPRLELLPGDFFQGVPSRGDIYVLKNILHDWDDARARDILASCRRAMDGPARLLIIEHVVGRSNQSCAGTIGDIQMMVRTSGRNRTAEELRELLVASGFHLRRIISTGGGPDIVEASLSE